MNDTPTLRSLVWPVLFEAPDALRNKVINSEEHQWVLGDSRIDFAEDGPDDSGRMVYAWCEYFRDGEDDDWYPCGGGDAGYSDQLVAALRVWVAS